MAHETYERYYDLIRSPYGMVICAGPTGSGKTTTLYATLTAINNDEINVMTIEDPVEYVFPTINQIQINEPAGVTFANGLRSILRQDPDAILVGEIRDVETARIATQAALTGHFVMSSLHATDATSRAAPLHGHGHRAVPDRVVAARRRRPAARPQDLRALRRAVHADARGARRSTSAAAATPTRRLRARASGCNFCGQTGYYDRVGIYEVLAGHRRDQGAHRHRRVARRAARRSRSSRA